MAWLGKKTCFVAFAVLALIALHVTLALRSVATKSVTVDEIFHVTGGYFYNTFGDFRIHPDNGVLPQRLHALPAVLSGAKPPPLVGNEYWRLSDVYVVSHQFFYESGNDHWPLLMAARRMNILFSVGIALLVFFWARNLAGAWAGLVALAMATLSPTMLAHGPLATSDAAAALCLTASATAFWWQLRHGSPVSMLVSAATFGLACAAKFSAVLLLPIFAVLVLVHFLITPAVNRRLGRVALSLGVHALGAWIFIWACFGFRYSAFAPGVPPADQFIMSWDWMLDRAGWQAGPLRWIRDHQLLPEGFLFGYTHTYVGSLTRASYLAGEYSNFGRVAFFPLAFWWKSTLPELVGAVAAITIAAMKWRVLRPWLVRLAPLIVLVAVYGTVALNSELNIGHRHLLPLYPALFMLTGIAAVHVVKAPERRLALGAICIAAQLATAVSIYPHYLAYFNSLAGGPANGWRLLVDSSLDWGQDLLTLKAWLDKSNSGANAQPVFLSYFGSGEPEYYNIKARRLPFVNGFKTPHPYVALEAGIYCVSATTLVHVYSPLRGPWTAALEEEYQRLRALEPQFAEYMRNAQRRTELEREMPAAAWRNAWTRHDALRFARLCHYLRVRPADATVGHSILIYRLSPAEITGATGGSLENWSALIENVTTAKHR